MTEVEADGAFSDELLRVEGRFAQQGDNIRGSGQMVGPPSAVDSSVVSTAYAATVG
jgi:hypothetical protein